MGFTRLADVNSFGAVVYGADSNRDRARLPQGCLFGLRSRRLPPSAGASHQVPVFGRTFAVTSIKDRIATK